MGGEKLFKKMPNLASQNFLSNMNALCGWDKTCKREGFRSFRFRLFSTAVKIHSKKNEGLE